MVKKSLLCFALIFLAVQLVSFASAIDTEITVKTLPDYQVQLTTYNPYSETSILNAKYDYFIGNADESGEATFIFSTTKSNFNILLYIKDLEGTTVVKKTYDEEYVVGEDVVLDHRPEWFKKYQEINNAKEDAVITETNASEESATSENETAEEVIVVNETSEDDSATITQFAIFGEDGSSVLKVIVYIIGGLVVLAIIVMLVLRGMKMMKKRKEEMGDEDDDSRKSIKIKKLSEMKTERRESMEDYNDMIDDAEEKIREALDSIERLRKSDKISEIKKRMIEDERELMKLRKG